MRFVDPAIRGLWTALGLTAALSAAPAALGAEAGPPSTGAATAHLVRLPDGRRMNLVCMGEGSPVVILENGLGHSAWSLVQDQLARTTRTCAYDRAGMGFSDEGPRPRDASAVAADLHALLPAAGLKGPYVLVGHSIGGFFVRMYADLFPDEVAGLVLVDPSVENATERALAAEPALLATIKTDEPGQIEVMRRCAVAAQAGEMKPGAEIYKHCAPAALADLPPDVRSALIARYEAPAIYRTMASELESFDRDGKELTAHARSYGDMPLIVLTPAERPNIPALTAEENRQGARLSIQMHAEQAALSSRGQERLVRATGHYIQTDQPQAVIDAVNQVVADARQHAGAGR